MQQVVGELYQIPVGIANAFLFDRTEANPEEGLTLVDTGVPDSESKVLDAIRHLGRQPQDLKRILLTHGHADHIGSAGALQRATGADVYIHEADASIVRTGSGFRPMQPAPGLKNKIVFSLVRTFFISRHKTVQPATVTGSLRDGETLPFAGGLRVVHVPGHCSGQVVLLWQGHGGVLLAADTCGNQGGLALSIGYEDIAQGRRDLQKLATLPFETACFGHGKPLTGGAGSKFQSTFGS